MTTEKQIEEMTDTINDMYGVDAMYFGVDSNAIAHHLYEAGYRKQSEGEWIVESEHSIRCSECCFNRAAIKMPLDYCPNCGAMMKGGTE